MIYQMLTYLSEAAKLSKSLDDANLTRGDSSTAAAHFFFFFVTSVEASRDGEIS